MAIRPQVELKADSGSGRFGARSAARWTSVYSPGQHAGSPFLLALPRRSRGADHLHVQRAKSVPETSRVFSRTNLSRGEGSEQASAPSTSPASLPGMNQAFVKKFYHAYPISAREKTTAFNKKFSTSRCARLRPYLPVGRIGRRGPKSPGRATAHYRERPRSATGIPWVSASPTCAYRKLRPS